MQAIPYDEQGRYHLPKREIPAVKATCPACGTIHILKTSQSIESIRKEGRWGCSKEWTRSKCGTLIDEHLEYETAQQHYIAVYPVCGWRTEKYTDEDYLSIAKRKDILCWECGEILKGQVWADLYYLPGSKA